MGGSADMEPSRKEIDELVSMLIDIWSWYLFGVAASAFGLGVLFGMVVSW
jgi:hypothetical protein